ncbi:MAG TPA: hypothetical protein VFI62_12925 [Burkholderiales bacterium]|nr:hypothetical protein [Burkholderiales bacterium]
MKRCITYLGVFGDWGWECVSDDGVVVDESREVFERYEDCVADARQHGCDTAQRSNEAEVLIAA